MNSYHIRTGTRSIWVDIQRKKMKTVRLKVHRDGQVVLSAPHAVTDQWIERYIEGKSGWIQKQLDRLHPDNQAIPPILENGSRVRILGKEYAVELRYSARNAVEVREEQLVIACRTSDPEAISRQLDRWWRTQAMNLFTALLNKYYPIVASQGVGMPRLAIRKMKTLWGSCSTHRGVITLNFYLYKVPPECVEYIVFHELAHFLYRRHDREFYGFIARYMPDWKERRRAVKNEYPG